MQTINGKKIVRSIAGGYHQDVDGKWWLWNAMHGWLRANTMGRAFLRFLNIHTKASLLQRRTATRQRPQLGQVLGNAVIYLDGHRGA